MKSSSVLPPLFAIALFPAICGASLTSVYTFNETSGNTAADSIRGAPAAGTLNNFGGSQWVAGKIGNAVEFDGANDFIIALNAVPTGTTAFTVSAWIWADTAPTWGSVVKNWGSVVGSFHLGFDNNTGRISNYLASPQDGPVITPAALTLNAWHHVALTYSGALATQTLFLDGVQVSQRTTAPADLEALSTNMGIGVKPDNTTTLANPAVPGYWDGKIDDLAFWDEALTPAQIAAIKANGDAGIGVIPEPASAAFLALGMAAVAIRRRR